MPIRRWSEHGIQGITVEIGGDTTKLSSALSGVNKEIDSAAFMEDLMARMKIPERKEKRGKNQKETVGDIFAAMQGMDSGRSTVPVTERKPPAPHTAKPGPMQLTEPEDMEAFSLLASNVMRECHPAAVLPQKPLSEKTVRVAAYIRVSSTNPAQEDSYEIQERYFISLLANNGGWRSASIYSDHGKDGSPPLDGTACLAWCGLFLWIFCQTHCYVQNSVICYGYRNTHLLHHPGEDLLFDFVAVQKQTVNLCVGGGGRMCQTAYQKVICGYISLKKQLWE